MRPDHDSDPGECEHDHACHDRRDLRHVVPTLGPHAGRSPRSRVPMPAGLARQGGPGSQVEGIEYPDGGPRSHAAPAGRWRAAAKFMGGQQPPRGGGLGHVQGRGKAAAIGDHLHEAVAGFLSTALLGPRAPGQLAAPASGSVHGCTAASLQPVAGSEEPVGRESSSTTHGCGNEVVGERVAVRGSARPAVASAPPSRRRPSRRHSVTARRPIERPGRFHHR
jgi:hypothetical protein